MAKDDMHASTTMRISERLGKTIAVLERENTPEEYKKALKDLKMLAKEVEIHYAEKPISKKAWNNLWASVIGDFIISFEHNAVNRELSDEDHHEAFLEGMAKGMWTIYNMIEELMVREDVPPLLEDSIGKA
jgi:hypothetical protein